MVNKICVVPRIIFIRYINFFHPLTINGMRKRLLSFPTFQRLFRYSSSVKIVLRIKNNVSDNCRNICRRAIWETQHTPILHTQNTYFHCSCLCMLKTGRFKESESGIKKKKNGIVYRKYNNKNNDNNNTNGTERDFSCSCCGNNRFHISEYVTKSR